VSIAVKHDVLWVEADLLHQDAVRALAHGT
jgi:hypothetical protein